MLKKGLEGAKTTATLGMPLKVGTAATAGGIAALPVGAYHNPFGVFGQ